MNFLTVERVQLGYRAIAEVERASLHLRDRETEFIAVSNQSESIERMVKAIYDRHGVTAIHLGTECVVETAQGKVLWKGGVEVFTITRHPEARLCYAWTYTEGPTEHVASVLRIPPIRTELDAVRAVLAEENRNRKRN